MEEREKRDELKRWKEMAGQPEGDLMIGGPGRLRELRAAPADSKSARLGRPGARGQAAMLTLDERRRMLATFARNSGPAVAVQAIIKDDDMERRWSPPEAERGPGEPLTSEERIERVRLMLGCLTEAERAGLLEKEEARGSEPEPGS